MTDYTFKELQDLAKLLDVLGSMGAVAKKSQIEPTFTLWPGQSPVIRLKDMRVPLGVPGRDAPVRSVVPEHLMVGIDLGGPHETTVVNVMPPISDDLLTLMRKHKLPEPEPEPVAAVTPSAPAAGLPGPSSSVEAGQVESSGKLQRRAKPEEVAQFDALIRDAATTAKAEGRSVKAALIALAEEHGRSPKALEVRWYNVLNKADRRADGHGKEVLGGERGGLQLHHPAENAPVQGVEPVSNPEAQPEPEPPADRPMAGGDSLPDAGWYPDRQAPEPEPEPEPETPAAVTPPAGGTSQPDGLHGAVRLAPSIEQDFVPQDELTAHLLAPRVRRDFTYHQDVELLTKLDTGWPRGSIAADMGLTAVEVTTRDELLTGYDRASKARRFSRKAVIARLEQLGGPIRKPTAA